jgi:hypothetical protein
VFKACQVERQRAHVRDCTGKIVLPEKNCSGVMLCVVAAAEFVLQLQLTRVYIKSHFKTRNVFCFFAQTSGDWPGMNLHRTVAQPAFWREQAEIAHWQESTAAYSTTSSIRGATEFLRGLIRRPTQRQRR